MGLRVTTECGVCRIEEPETGLFKIVQIAGAKGNPWGFPRVHHKKGYTRDLFARSLILRIGEPFCIDGRTGQQITRETLVALGLPLHNRILRIEPWIVSEGATGQSDA